MEGTIALCLPALHTICQVSRCCSSAAQCRANITYTVSAVLKVDRTAFNWSGQLEDSTPLTVYSYISRSLHAPRAQEDSSVEGDIADCCGCCMSCPTACLGCRGCASVRGHTWCRLGVDSKHVANGEFLQPQAMVLVSTCISPCQHTATIMSDKHACRVSIGCLSFSPRKWIAHIPSTIKGVWNRS